VCVGVRVVGYVCCACVRGCMCMGGCVCEGGGGRQAGFL